MCYTFMLKKIHVNHRSLPPTSAIEALDCLDVGKSGIVYALDARRVVKRYEGDNDDEIDAEREVYDRLGPHPNIAGFLGALDDGSIVLERGQVLRDRLSEQTRTRPIPLRTKYRWIKQAATGLQYLHDCNIIQADVGCRNMIIAHGNLKLIDFEGCSIDGNPPTSSYEWFSYKPSTPRATVQTDIFALGCAIYEIITGKPPYHDLKGLKDARERVERLYDSNQFPDVADLPMGSLMLDCWHGKFSSMREVVERIELPRQSTTRSRHVMNWCRMMTVRC
ncbi:serine/threonine protein kinase [Capronia epimyces CBS 606.96]|uniref:Serine/threonine protein kinase n=1 Tax=Capronia epimyces CBS 606.96 TaxID=1182542 RepID=W9XQ07_9EURO|nr:serine/threonine protein kinase [Capronia epimyces CBS 606.96]EXJ82308.1 serine/threonine protein kinase [Capronia epimyces CBS 606.96]